MTKKRLERLRNFINKESNNEYVLNIVAERIINAHLKQK